MLTLITGKVGGGKTYLGVETALRGLQEGAVVHTNMPLKWGELHARYPGQLVQLPHNPRSWIRANPPRESVAFGSTGFVDDGPMFECADFIVGGAEGRENLVILDEASFQYGSDDQSTKDQKDKLKPVKQLVTLQRHVGLDIIFITQSSKKIDAKLREDASERIHCIKASQMPFIGWLAQPLFGDFLRVYYDQSGVKVSRTWHRFKQAVGDSYDTHGFRSSVAMRVDPTRQAKTGETGKKGMTKMLVTLGLCLAAIWFGVTSTYGRLVGDKKPLVAESPASVAKPAVAVAEPRLPLSSPPLSHSRPLVEVEWFPEDEWIIQTITRGRGADRVGVRGGLTLFVGGYYMGEEIAKLIQHRDWRYFITESGRVVVARPVHPYERESWRQEHIQRVEGVKQQQRPLEAVSGAIKGAVGL